MTPDLVGGLESPDYASHDKAAHGEPYTPVFTGEVRRELDTLLTRYPTKMAALLPALWIVQREHRWVSEEAMEEVAGLLELTPAYVKGVVTFYTRSNASAPAALQLRSWSTKNSSNQSRPTKFRTF